MSVTDHLQKTGDKKIGGEELRDELHQPIWSVISFDRHEAAGLVYSEAIKKLEELGNRSVTGLCIVTDEAAARTGRN